MIRAQNIGILIGLAALAALAATPILPPRDYSVTVVAVTGDEAVALQTATFAMQRYIEKLPTRPLIGTYYATVERQAPSFWRVRWAINNSNARGGGVDISLDPTGTKVVTIKPIE